MEVGGGEKGGSWDWRRKAWREGRRVGREGKWREKAEELGEEKERGERRQKSWEGRKEERRVGGGGWNGMYGMKTQDLMPLGLDIG